MTLVMLWTKTFFGKACFYWHYVCFSATLHLFTYPLFYFACYCILSCCICIWTCLEVDWNPFEFIVVKVQAVHNILSLFSKILHEVNLMGSVHKLCSDACFQQFRISNKLSVNCCITCGGYCYGTDGKTLLVDGTTKKFCSQQCVFTFKKVLFRPLWGLLCYASIFSWYDSCQNGRTGTHTVKTIKW